MRHWIDERRTAIASVIAVTVALVAGACMPDIEQDEAEPAERVQPVFDSEAETIPLPNDVALDEQGTLPDLEGIEREDAQGEFLRWLSTLHGWLPATDIEIPFDGELDPETVDTDSVHLFREIDGAYESVEIGEVVYREATIEVSGEDGEIREIDGSSIRIVPAEELGPREEYAAVVTDDIEDTEGRTLVEPQSIFFAASEEPLIDEAGNPTIESLETLPPEQLQQLEGLRQSLQPVFEHAADQGIERGDIAMAFRWSTVRDPMTILDPETATLPLPNTAALEEDGTFPGESALEEFPDRQNGELQEADTAQEYFNVYLDRLHGWPPTTPITLPISGEVDEETLDTETVQLWTRSGEEGEPEQIELESINYDAESGTVELVPATDLQNRSEYVAFATNGVRNEEGDSLKLPAPLQMAIQPHPVLEDGESTVEQISDDEAQAIRGLREFLRPAATFVDEETDADLDELGAIWNWHTWSDTFAVFDPTTGSIPFPHEAVRTGEDGSVELPTEGLSGLQAALIEELNRRFGFSTIAPGWIPFDGPVDPSSFSDDEVENVQFLWVPPDDPPIPEVYSSGRYRLEYRPEWDQVVVETEFPWKRDPNLDPTDEEADSARNAGLVTTDVMGANGHPVRPTPAFVFLRSPHSVFENGESTVDQLDDETAERLEESRAVFDRLFDIAPVIGGLNVDERDDVAMAWAWHPENTPQTVQEFRAQARATLDDRSDLSVSTRACEPDCGQSAPDMPNVETVFREIEFETVEFLDDNSRMRRFMETEDEPVGISIFVPDRTACNNEPVDVALVQHGFGGSRVQAGNTLADVLAAECLATVAMDFPLHGGRTPGTDTLHPDMPPQNSGMGFFSTDVVGSKNHVIQSIVDLAVLTAIIEADGLEAATNDNRDWFTSGDEGEIGYIGLSLGGFAGVPFTTIEPDVETAVFSATGGKLARVLTEGALGGELVSALDDAGLEEGSFERYRALAFMEWLADPVDPFSFTPFITDSPAFEPPEPLREMTFEPGSGFSTGSPVPDNEVLLQMMEAADSMDDPIVPNATTELLAEAMGISSETLEESTFTGPHSLLFVTDDENDAFDAAECARGQAAAWLASGLEEGTEASIPDALTSSNCP